MFEASREELISAICDYFRESDGTFFADEFMNDSQKAKNTMMWLCIHSIFDLTQEEIMSNPNFYDVFTIRKKLKNYKFDEDEAHYDKKDIRYYDTNDFRYSYNYYCVLHPKDLKELDDLSPFVDYIEDHEGKEYLENLIKKDREELQKIQKRTEELQSPPIQEKSKTKKMWGSDLLGFFVIIGIGVLIGKNF